MDIPHRGQRPSMSLPEIYVHESHPNERYHRASSRSGSHHSVTSPGLSSVPMSIPNAREPVPPPLPPPKHIADLADSRRNGPDIAWQWGNSAEGDDWGRAASSVPPGSSLYGSFTGRGNNLADEHPDARRGSSVSTVKSISGVVDTRDNYPRIDEGYASLSGSSIGSKMHDTRGFQSSVHDRFQSNAQAYDKSLLQKLDSRRGSEDVTTPSRSFSKFTFSSSASDASPTSRIALEHRHPTLKPLSLPINTRRPGPEDLMARWGNAETPLSAVSPGNTYPRFGNSGPFDYRSPNDTASDLDRSPHQYARRSASMMSMCDDASSVTSRSREGYERSPETDGDFQTEETGLTRLQIDDYSSRDAYSPGSAAGQKRRASEDPPREDGSSLHTVGSASDLFRRRESGSRSSPSPRYHSTSGSISSTASGPRSNSYVSTMSLAASSITSMGSYGRVSPGGISPGASDMGPDSPYVTSMSLNPSPRGSISRTNHTRALSADTRPLMTSRKLSEGIGHVKHNSAPKMHGVFICECCPKKPKKFDTQEDLIAHEQEKQYECAYCHNRFKNKNEAERHQNSLHLRKNSWSCAALSGYEAAFHPSPLRPNEADTCGYCGEEFLRCGLSSPSTPQILVATNQDWEIRIGHLQEEHKFGECNQAKKFFRADHFRQHLKHSHAGTSGKWTNMLENSCMKDEPLPEPISRPERSGIGMSRLNKTLGGPGPVSPGGMGPRVGRIEEEEIL
ncbi:hypothetical protein BP5796_02644 [Coleophoma crateriformis]|uniref:C2H2-type domain-containing protein n=1 Tax=Coleophoma crateriformis TaxID=565419 RepID=A0A3D8SYZ7_9HELO|nr:hypothetical protein BP5796_02644 [Coleophoma crateriformis]